MDEVKVENGMPLVNDDEIDVNESKQPVYEITQTDHVNAKLLSSFKDSIPSQFIQEDSDEESWE